MAKSDADHARELLAMAEADRTALENMLDAQRFPEQIFGFHAQQAIEKALKAWISSLHLRYPKTHDLSILIGVLREADLDVTWLQGMEDYTVFAVQYRYESYDPEDEQLDRPEVLRETRNLIARVQSAIEPAN